MSQPPSSTDPLFVPTVSEEQMVGFLAEYCAQDAPPGPVQRLLDLLRDPFVQDEDDRYRLNPLWVSLAVFLLIALANFVYFSFRSF